MPENQSVAIQPIHPQDSGEKRALQKVILKKRKILIAKITKNEMLRIELDMIKHEYHVRVGSLYIRSNQQDLEIIYYKNLLELMQEGFTYEDALKKLDATYYGEQKKIEEEKENLRFEKEIFQKRAENNAEGNDIKKLWKYLVSKFHPDLVVDAEEKKRREEIMKQVNRAYEERNINVLMQLKNEVAIEFYEENSIENLTSILVDIENEIIQQDISYKILRNSEWYTWKIKISKAAKQNKDIFIDIERPLLNEIVRNDQVLESLQKEIREMRIRR